MIDYLRGFALIVGFLFLGVLLHHLGAPIPGGVLGLLLLYVALSLGLMKLNWVEKTANLLLRHMALMFVPLTVALVDMGSVLGKQAVPIVGSLVISLVIALLTTGLLGRWLLPSESVLPESELLPAEQEAAEAGR